MMLMDGITPDFHRIDCISPGNQRLMGFAFELNGRCLLGPSYKERVIIQCYSCVLGREGLVHDNPRDDVQLQLNRWHQLGES